MPAMASLGIGWGAPSGVETHSLRALSARQTSLEVRSRTSMASCSALSATARRLPGVAASYTAARRAASSSSAVSRRPRGMRPRRSRVSRSGAMRGASLPALSGLNRRRVLRRRRAVASARSA